MTKNTIENQDFGRTCIFAANGIAEEQERLKHMPAAPAYLNAARDFRRSAKQNQEGENEFGAFSRWPAAKRNQKSKTTANPSARHRQKEV
jgi:hypothetical protein